MEMETLVLHGLVPACQRLSMQSKNLRERLRNELGWVVLAPDFTDAGIPPVEAVISSLCDIDINASGSPIPSFYGIAHISESLAADIEIFNATKKEFQTVILDIRKKQGKRERNIALAKLITGDGRYCRDPNVQRALKTVGFATLDLIACYKEIKVLPRELVSVSWTWQRRREEMFKMNKAQAVLYAHRSLGGDALEITLKQIAALSDTEQYVRIRGQNIPQLKANYAYRCKVKDEATGKRVDGINRTMITASNIFLTTATEMPKTTFKPRPDGINEERKLRTDITIHDEPIILSINLYRYLTDYEAHDLRVGNAQRSRSRASG